MTEKKHSRKGDKKKPLLKEEKSPEMQFMVEKKTGLCKKGFVHASATNPFFRRKKEASARGFFGSGGVKDAKERTPNNLI